MNNGWGVLKATATDWTMEYTTDSHRGRVLHLDAGSTSTGAYDAQFIHGENYDNLANSTSTGIVRDWDADGGRRHLAMWIKNGYTSQPYQVSVLVKTDQLNGATINFISTTGVDNVDGDCINIHTGTMVNDGAWHYREFDLESALTSVRTTDTVTGVYGMVMIGNDLYVDDVVLSGGAMHRSYQVIPGALISAVLGAQDGPQETGLSERWYYHYDDLGTVVATTDETGSGLGVYQPDHWGNYRKVSGIRPDLMGITGKFFDEDTGAYFFNARWFAPERKTWLSKDPLGYRGGVNLYTFVSDDVINKTDSTGMCPDSCYDDCISRNNKPQRKWLNNVGWIVVPAAVGAYIGRGPGAVALGYAGTVYADYSYDQRMHEKCMRKCDLYRPERPLDNYPYDPDNFPPLVLRPEYPPDFW